MVFPWVSYAPNVLDFYFLAFFEKTGVNCFRLYDIDTVAFGILKRVPESFKNSAQLTISNESLTTADLR